LIKLVLKSFEGFRVLALSWSGHTLYRGVRKWNFPLTPRIGRNWKEALGPDGDAASFSKYEGILLDEFKREARAYTSAPTNEWEWLALAQHHGVPTRLLDWTWNALAALYFAVDPDSREGEHDAAVYAVPAINFHWLKPDEQLHTNPLGVDKVVAYTPPRIFPRLVAQASVFSVHRDPREPISLEGVARLRIPRALIPEVRETLFAFHAMPKTLFPDLDGLARSMRQWHSERRGWGLLSKYVPDPDSPGWDKDEMD
jgi:hypothetical protein